MKKYIATLAAGALLITLTACAAGSTSATSAQSVVTTTVTQQHEATEATTVTVAASPSTVTVESDPDTSTCAAALEKGEAMIMSLIDLSKLYIDAVGQAAYGLLDQATATIENATEQTNYITDNDVPEYGALRASCLGS